MLSGTRSNWNSHAFLGSMQNGTTFENCLQFLVSYAYTLPYNIAIPSWASALEK